MTGLSKVAGCAKHPSYQVRRAPTSTCETCWDLWQRRDQKPLADHRFAPCMHELGCDMNSVGRADGESKCHAENPRAIGGVCGRPRAEHAVPDEPIEVGDAADSYDRASAQSVSCADHKPRLVTRRPACVGCREKWDGAPRQSLDEYAAARRQTKCRACLLRTEDPALWAEVVEHRRRPRPTSFAIIAGYLATRGRSAVGLTSLKGHFIGGHEQ